MENRFAGTQNQAGRRRRRLAHADPEPVGFVDAIDHIAIAESDVEGSAIPHTPQQFSMLPRVVSRRLWKHVAILLLMLAASVTAVWWEHRTTVAGVSSITRGIVGLFILLSAQLAWVISWIRSCSEVDFQGRYRCWRWFSVTASALAVTVLTDTYASVPELVTVVLTPITGAIKTARPALVLVTLVPVAVLVPVRVLRDMSRCVWSRLFLVSAILLTIVRFMLVYGAADASISLFTLNLLLVLASMSVFASMLLHCRFVAFISNAPPVARRSKDKKLASAVDDVTSSDNKAEAPAPVTPPREEETATEPAAVQSEPPPKRPSKRQKKKGRRKAA
ncbi:MAG: hypothetical protein GY903_19915 [Fuerstiella sp.]|nr:hypothetical protein [Fuerstiella sp.]